MGKCIELLTNSYEKGLKMILKDYEAFCEKHELDEVNLELKRIEDTIEVRWLIFCDEVDSIQEVYHDYISFVDDCKEEVELEDVSLEDGEFYAQYIIKRSYVLSSL